MKTKSRIRLLLSLAQDATVPGAQPSPSAPASPTSPTSPQSPTTTIAPKVPPSTFTGSENLFTNIDSCWGANNKIIIVNMSNILNKILSSIPNNNLLLNNLYPSSQVKLGPTFKSGGGIEEVLNLCKMGLVPILDLKKSPNKKEDLTKKQQLINNFKNLVNKLPTNISQKDAINQLIIKIENSLK